jgi:hypothetical protein
MSASRRDKFRYLHAAFRLGRAAAGQTDGRPGGGGDRARTDDPLLAKQVLSQLSYTPVQNAVIGYQSSEQF